MYNLTMTENEARIVMAALYVLRQQLEVGDTVDLGPYEFFNEDLCSTEAALNVTAKLEGRMIEICEDVDVG